MYNSLGFESGQLLLTKIMIYYYLQSGSLVLEVAEPRHSCPIHVVTFTLISNLATDYIQKSLATWIGHLDRNWIQSYLSHLCFSLSSLARSQRRDESQEESKNSLMCNQNLGFSIRNPNQGPISCIGYGNTGRGVFKRGLQNQKDFCLRINILKGNY